MELSDVKNKQALSEQLERYSIIADQLADNIQDLGKLEIASDQIKDIETAKSMISRASPTLSMVAEGRKEENYSDVFLVRYTT